MRATCSPCGQRAFVDDAAHRRVDELLPQHPQPALVQLGHRDRAHQPAHDGHARERVHQRADAVGVADVGLGAGRADRLRARLRARRAAHGVAGGDELGRQRAAPAAAGHDQHARHAQLVRRWPVAPALLGELLAVAADARLDLLLVALGQPARRRISFCASIICATSSMSFCASTSGERVGFQSRMSSAERLENSPSSRTKTTKKRERAPEDDGERVDAGNTRTGERATGGHRRTRRGDDGRRASPSSPRRRARARCCTTPTPRRSSAGWRARASGSSAAIEKGRAASASELGALEAAADARRPRGRRAGDRGRARGPRAQARAVHRGRRARRATTACWPPTRRR